MMTRKRLTPAAAILLVLACTPITLVRAQSDQKTPADNIGAPRDTAQKITKPASVAKGKFPDNTPPLGPTLELSSRETTRLPSSFRTMKVSVNAQYTLVALFIDEDTVCDLVLTFVHTKEPFASAFDVLRRLDGVVPKRDLPTLWPKIEAIHNRSDEQKFIAALATTMDAYRAAPDYPSAADILNGLHFRANYGLRNDARIREFSTTQNAIYAYDYRKGGGGMPVKLWVFDNDGGLLAEVHCRKDHWPLALAVAESMGPSATMAGMDTAPRKDGKTELAIGNEVVESTPERLRKIAMGVHLYHTDHGKYPEAIKELVGRKILPQAILSDSREKDEQADVVYIRPITTSEDWGHNPPVMLYTQYDSWPENGLWVGLADGAVLKVTSEAAFRDLRKLHAAPDNRDAGAVKNP